MTPGWLLAAALEPDDDEARDLLLDELSKLEYAQAQPTWFDLLVQAVLDWFGSLRLGGGGGFPLGVLLYRHGLMLGDEGLIPD